MKKPIISTTMYCLSSMRHNGIITEKEDLMHNFTDYKKHINNEVFKSTDKRLPNNLKIVDTVGCGDSFSASFLYAYLCGIDLVESAGFANRIGTYTASCSGAIPEYSQEIINELKKIKQLAG